MTKIMKIKFNTKTLESSIFDNVSIETLKKLAIQNPAYRGYTQGYLAEEYLELELLKIENVSLVTKIPDKDPEKGDFKVIYKNQILTIELKSISTDTVKQDFLHDSWQGTVSFKNTDSRNLNIPGLGTIKSSALERGQFDILAISCYAVSGTWSYIFMENEYLPQKSIKTPNLIKTSFVINPMTTPCLIFDLIDILEIVYLKKLNKAVKI